MWLLICLPASENFHIFLLNVLHKYFIPAFCLPYHMESIWLGLQVSFSSNSGSPCLFWKSSLRACLTLGSSRKSNPNFCYQCFWLMAKHLGLEPKGFSLVSQNVLELQQIVWHVSIVLGAWVSLEAGNWSDTLYLELAASFVSSLLQGDRLQSACSAWAQRHPEKAWSCLSAPRSPGRGLSWRMTNCFDTCHKALQRESWQEEGAWGRAG